MEATLFPCMGTEWVKVDSLLSSLGRSGLAWCHIWSDYFVQTIPEANLFWMLINNTDPEIICAWCILATALKEACSKQAYLSWFSIRTFIISLTMQTCHQLLHASKGYLLFLYTADFEPFAHHTISYTQDHLGAILYIIFYKLQMLMYALFDILIILLLPCEALWVH